MLGYAWMNLKINFTTMSFKVFVTNLFAFEILTLIQIKPGQAFTQASEQTNCLDVIKQKYSWLTKLHRHFQTQMCSSPRQ